MISTVACIGIDWGRSAFNYVCPKASPQRFIVIVTTLAGGIIAACNMLGHQVLLNDGSDGSNHLQDHESHLVLANFRDTAVGGAVILISGIACMGVLASIGAIGGGCLKMYKCWKEGELEDIEADMQL